MTEEYCPCCGAKMIWSEETHGSEFNRESACPRCLLHIHISNGHVRCFREITIPDKPQPELRKPREWRVWVGESGLWFDKVFDLERFPDKPFIRVREVID